MGKTRFGQLLESYRQDRKMTLRQLAQSLDWQWDTSSISRYQNGARPPTAEFIYQVSRVLNLNADQESALLDAHVFDIVMEFLVQYQEILRRHRDVE